MGRKSHMCLSTKRKKRKLGKGLRRYIEEKRKANAGPSTKHDELSRKSEEDLSLKQEEFTLEDYGEDILPGDNSPSDRPVLQEYTDCPASPIITIKTECDVEAYDADATGLELSQGASTSNLKQECVPFESVLCDQISIDKVKKEIVEDEDLAVESINIQKEGLGEEILSLVEPISQYADDEEVNVDGMINNREQNIQARKVVKRKKPQTRMSSRKTQKIDHCKYCPNKSFVESSSLLEHYAVEHPGMYKKTDPTNEERRALNFLIHDYLLQLEYTLTANMFADENKDQDFDTWDDVGVEYERPEDLVQVYRQALAAGGRALTVASCASEASLPTPQEEACQLQILSLNNDLGMLRVKLKELSQQISRLEEEKSSLQAQVERLTPGSSVHTLEDESGVPQPQHAWQSTAETVLPPHDRQSILDTRSLGVSSDSYDTQRAGPHLASGSELRHGVGFTSGVQHEVNFLRAAHTIQVPLMPPLAHRECTSPHNSSGQQT